jgi:signal transduction histidine kinase
LVINLLIRFEIGIVIISLGFYRLIPQVLKHRDDEVQLATERNLALLYLDLLGHDIRNNLQVISMSASLLTEVAENVVATGMLDNIQESVEKCNTIILKVKTTSDLPSSTLKKVSLRKIVTERCESFARENSQVVISNEILTDNAVIMGNEYIEHLLDNLLENAIEHNPRNEKFVWIKMTPNESGYTLSIADNGSGIPEDKRNTLFDMTERYGGIGLHQSKHIVEKLGGHIEIGERIEGDYTKGAVFQIFFPSAKDMKLITAV